MDFVRSWPPFWLNFGSQKSTPEALGREKVNLRFWTTLQAFSMVLASDGALGVSKSTSKPYPKINKIFYCFSLPKWLTNGTKRTSSLTQSGIKNRRKSNRHLAAKNTLKSTQKSVPNGVPNDTKTIKNRRLGLQGALGDSWGSPGLPPGRPRRKNYHKI